MRSVRLLSVLCYAMLLPVHSHCGHLARLRSCSQGPTSSGKTSLVSYLAAQTGHTFVRINNHEQTDLQVRAVLADRLFSFFHQGRVAYHITAAPCFAAPLDIPQPNVQLAVMDW